MRALMILGLAAVLTQSGCSTNRHVLEPGVDKRREVSPEAGSRGCCSTSACECGDCRASGPCSCRHTPESYPVPPSGITP